MAVIQVVFREVSIELRIVIGVVALKLDESLRTCKLIIQPYINLALVKNWISIMGSLCQFNVEASRARALSHAGNQPKVLLCVDVNIAGHSVVVPAESPHQYS